MQKTIETLSTIVRKYRGKDLQDPEFSQKLAEDVVKTVGIKSLDPTIVLKDLFRSSYKGINLGDTTANRRLVDDIIYTFDRAGAGIDSNLKAPDGLHEIEPPLTREQVAEMYSTSEEEVKPQKSVKKSFPKSKKAVEKVK